MIFVFSVTFRSIHQRRIFKLRQIHPSFIIIKNYMNPNNKVDIQRFYHLEIPIKFSMFEWYHNLILMGRFFYTILDVDYQYHVFMYILDQHRLRATLHTRQEL